MPTGTGDLVIRVINHRQVQTRRRRVAPVGVERLGFTSGTTDQEPSLRLLERVPVDLAVGESFRDHLLELR